MSKSLLWNLPGGWLAGDRGGNARNRSKSISGDVKREEILAIQSSDVDGCPCWLEKVATVAKPKHACKLIGAIDYSLGSAAKQRARVHR